ncbi:MAG: NAD(P)H-dependent oxidoreductase subunit E [Candidatus Aminicenantes bacterium]|nr:NAD(P)H-dependent oxidoreductase subunit E [Candidatus Aminicenantes bacterium]
MAVETSGRGPNPPRTKRCELIPLLQQAQKEEGFLSPSAIRRISRRLAVTENEIYGVATFYTQFRFRPPGRYNIKVCLGTACHVGGGQNFMDVMKTDKHIDHGETTTDGKFSLERVACLGCCALAPVVVVNDEVHGRMNRVTFMQLLETLDPSPEAALPAETEESPE